MHLNTQLILFILFPLPTFIKIIPHAITPIPSIISLCHSLNLPLFLFVFVCVLIHVVVGFNTGVWMLFGLFVSMFVTVCMLILLPCFLTCSLFTHLTASDQNVWKFPFSGNSDTSFSILLIPSYYLMLLTLPLYWYCSWSISQGELIDRIEHHVESSRDAVECAGGQVKVAGKHQKKARKVTCKDGGD